MDIRREKARIRRDMIARRHTLSGEEIAEKGRRILQGVLALPESSPSFQRSWQTADRSSSVMQGVVCPTLFFRPWHCKHPSDCMQ